jgi:hemerythrin-like domain-containing protein
MEFSRHVNRRLHEEHEATLSLWSRLEALFSSNKADAALVRNAAAALEHELDRHFAFEEDELFPRLAAGGEADLGELLAEEHVAIRQAGRAFIALAKQAPSDPGLRPLGLELAERLAAHVQKEEMSLLPAIEELLDEETDRELISKYAMT